ncbi:hypothetical protein [Sciscionella sediminilitoris]|uniref:hypothetical protein n=1 Tax=Sciscionella sediminilitoris TaxID=1445613 RepID=UPI0012E31568|nr:hypothetical protein [Sciscionella sp. SE31]
MNEQPRQSPPRLNDLMEKHANLSAEQRAALASRADEAERGYDVFAAGIAHLEQAGAKKAEDYLNRIEDYVRDAIDCFGIAESCGVPEATEYLAMLSFDRGDLCYRDTGTNDDMDRYIFNRFAFKAAACKHETVIAHPQNVDLREINRTRQKTSRIADIEKDLGHLKADPNFQRQIERTIIEAERLLAGQCSTEESKRLYFVLSNLHCTLGWILFDNGEYRKLRKHFAQTIQFARQLEDRLLIAEAIYAVGRSYQQTDAHYDAMQLFQLAQLSAEKSGNPRLSVLFGIYEAWSNTCSRYQHADYSDSEPDTRLTEQTKLDQKQLANGSLVPRDGSLLGYIYAVLAQGSTDGRPVDVVPALLEAMLLKSGWPRARKPRTWRRGHLPGS